MTPAPAMTRLSPGTACGIILELAKARLSALVLFTTAVGYSLGTHTPNGWDRRFGLALLGTMLCAWGANGLNQWWERVRDSQMARTRHRPLPSQRCRPRTAFWLSVLWSALGLSILAWQVNLLTAGLGLLTLLLYVLVYTPLKPRTSLCTVVGAVVGALPPLMGWTAATDTIGLPGLILAALLFVWQIPHFLALGWLYRDDYAHAGFRILPVIDREGWLTSRLVVLYSLALLPLSLALTWHGRLGWVYLLGATLLGSYLVAGSFQLVLVRNRDSARQVFLRSLIYLTALLVLILLDSPDPENVLTWMASR